MKTRSRAVTLILRTWFVTALLAAPGIILSSGCAKKAKTSGEQPNTPTVVDGAINGLTYTVISNESSGIRLTGSDISGDGTLLFDASPGPANANIAYRLTFTLDDGGSLSLLSHASETLANGSVVTFTRFSETLGVHASADPSAAHLLSEPAASGEINLTVTVRNAETPPHVTVAASSIVFDNLADQLSFAQGQGDRFGLRLSRAVLKRVSFELAADDDHATPQEFTVADLHAVGQKAINRFERMAITSSTFVSYKTWKTTDYIWVRLTYSVPDPAAAGGQKEDLFYMACHFHGNDLGCHKKDNAGTDEPKDDAPNEDPLPPPDPEL